MYEVGCMQGDVGPGSYNPILQDSHQASVIGGAPFASRTPKPGVPEPAKPLPANMQWPGMALYHLQHLNRKQDIPGPGDGNIHHVDQSMLY